MKLYETYLELEMLWSQLEGILAGEQIEGHDGLPLSDDVALEWFEKTLRDIEDERDEKAIRIACMIKNFRAEAEALKAEKQRLAKRQQVAERGVERLTTYLEQFLGAGVKVKDARASISWRSSTSVHCWADPGMLPKEYQRVKVEPDLTAIKTALQSGEEVAGAELKSRQNIQIR